MANHYENFAKDPELLKADLSPLQYQVTQNAGDRKSTRLNSSHVRTSRMPSSA